MANQLLSILNEWMSGSTTTESYSIVELLETLGLSDIIWVMLSPNRENYLIDHSKSIDRDFLAKFQENNNFEMIKNWMKDTLIDQIIEMEDSSRIVLYLNNDQYSNISMITSSHFNDTKRLSDTRMITKIGVNFINKMQKLQTLENSFRLGSVSKDQIIDQDLSKITINSLKPTFIQDVIPHIFYSYVHEVYGPTIFETIPDLMKEPDYMIIAVKLFSALDAEMVSDVGHVFKTDPIREPTTGEIFSVVFTLPNDKARGKFEIHSISILIPQELSNLSKSLIGEFKAQLFMAVEKLRYNHEEEGWGLAVEEFGSNDNIKDEVFPILEEIRQQIALSYALLMKSEDVLNW